VARPVTDCATEILAWADAWALPSDTVMTALKTPTSPAAGVPLRTPVWDENDIHAGRFETWKVNASPSGSDALGLIVNVRPTSTSAAAAMEIVGALFPDAGGGVETGGGSPDCPEPPPPEHASSRDAAVPTSAARIADAIASMSPCFMRRGS